MIRQTMFRFLTDESGATAIEYALMGSMIATVIVASVQALGIRVGVLFQIMSTAF
jgi:pilus assembly protein Flp/PilA